MHKVLIILDKGEPLIRLRANPHVGPLVIHDNVVDCMDLCRQDKFTPYQLWMGGI